MARCVFLAAIAVAYVTQFATAVTPFAKGTAFVTLDIKGDAVSGTIWLDRDAVEVKYPIDKNGDVDYTDAELLLIRGPLTDYINNNLHIMWNGEIHPISPSEFAYAALPVERNNGVKVFFSVGGYKAGTPILVFSRLLNDFWRQSQTVLALSIDGRKEIWSLGTGHYCDSRLSPGSRMPAASQPADHGGFVAASRFGCAAMCMGVDSTTPLGKCPRCGGPIAPLLGAPIPAKGYLGPMGGVLMSYISGAYKLEAVLVSKSELRFYLCSEALSLQPATPLSGKGQLWPAGSKSVEPPEELKLAKDGSYLSMHVPDNLGLPFQARCTLNSTEFPGTRMVEFYIPVIAGLPSDSAKH